MQDVTVWIRLLPGGKLGRMRDTRTAIANEARLQVEPVSDVVCGACGWMGRLHEARP